MKPIDKIIDMLDLLEIHNDEGYLECKGLVNILNQLISSHNELMKIINKLNKDIDKYNDCADIVQYYKGKKILTDEELKERFSDEKDK